MKFKIDEFLPDIFAAFLLCFGILLIREQRDIGDLGAGILFISIGIVIFLLKSLDFEHKSKVEKAEEKAIKFKKKFERKDLKQRNKEYKILKKEIFKGIIKGFSAVQIISEHTESIFTLRDRLNCDIDFKELHFTVDEERIYWERKK